MNDMHYLARQLNLGYYTMYVIPEGYFHYLKDHHCKIDDHVCTILSHDFLENEHNRFLADLSQDAYNQYLKDIEKKEQDLNIFKIMKGMANVTYSN